MSTMLDADQRPRIRDGFRLQWEAAQNSNVLLYPEGMVKLNGSAGEILSRCDGARTTEQIITDLERAFGRKDLRVDITAFLAAAIERGWIEMRP